MLERRISRERRLSVEYPSLNTTPTSLLANHHKNMHTHTHTCIHIHTHIHTHIYIHTHIHTYIHTHIHTYIHIYIHGLYSVNLTSTFIHIHSLSMWSYHGAPVSVPGIKLLPERMKWSAQCSLMLPTASWRSTHGNNLVHLNAHVNILCQSLQLLLQFLIEWERLLWSWW